MRDEKPQESWAVYLGDPTPTGTKVAGRLAITDEGLVFKAGIALAEHAGLLLGFGIPAHTVVNDAVSIPFAHIAVVRSERTKLILRSLEVHLVSGETVAFQFGAASPAQAERCLRQRIAR
ncbi:MAG: hypothetical protein PHU43_05030 [Candidatus Bipolaricaulis sp.]|nr:hypothetical protein [Candidatus Bipolaricaulis sp.]